MKDRHPFRTQTVLVDLKEGAAGEDVESSRAAR